MGLLKRLFSLGSKKGKKERPPIVHNVPVPELPWTGTPAVNEDEHEAAVGRLLRSSSARVAETSELDYATLPPLPHPINNVLQTPASSSLSLASTNLTRQGTYNVTVHKRRRHTSTEPPMPNAEGENEAKPSKKRKSLLMAEDSRILRLRSDPSVASLIDLYDDHGKLAADAFSNDSPRKPSTEGRAQVQRNGSTLRQLLGASSQMPSNDGNDSCSGEGDISWAERFLAETETASSNSSIGLPTPPASQIYHYTQALKPGDSFATDADISTGTFDNPGISSMEVEVSMNSDFSQNIQDLSMINNPYGITDPNTPQRASQVFGFLTKGKQSTNVGNFDRTLPELPSCFSSPSDENGSNLNFHFNDPPPITFWPTDLSAIPSYPENTPRPPLQRSSMVVNAQPAQEQRDSRNLRSAFSDAHPLEERRDSQCLQFTFSDAHPPRERHDSRNLRSAFSDDSHDPHAPEPTYNYVHHHDLQETDEQSRNLEEMKKNDIKVIMTGPTKVIVTAPTPGTNPTGHSRIPRGPRAPPKKSSGGMERRRSALVERSNSNSSTSSISDPFALNHHRRRQHTHTRSPSQTSVGSLTRSIQEEHQSKSRRNDAAISQKENQLGLTVKTELPSTPMRSNTTGSRSLLKTLVQQAMFHPPLPLNTPSPTLSSEMSPVGRQMMMDVRQQRMNARQVERERTSNRQSGSRRNAHRI